MVSVGGGYRSVKNQTGKGDLNFSRNIQNTTDPRIMNNATRTTGYTSAVGGQVTMLGQEASSFAHNTTNVIPTPGNEMVMNYPHSFDQQQQ